MDEVVRVLRRIGGGDNADGEVRDGPRPAPTGERASAVGTVPEPGTAATSATLAPGRWTQELAADFTASLDAAARRVLWHVWRAGERGIHRECTLPTGRPDAGGVALVADKDGPRAGEVPAGAGHGAVAGRWRPTARCRAISSTPTSPRWRRPRCLARGCRTSWPKACGAPWMDSRRWPPWESQTVHRLWNVLTIMVGLWIALACGVGRRRPDGASIRRMPDGRQHRSVSPDRVQHQRGLFR